MNQPPLNPDALEAMSRQIDPDWWQIIDNYPGDIATPRYRKTALDKAERYARAYLAAALPETRCVERHSPDLVCDGCEPPTPALPEVTSVPGVYDLGSPEPAGVDQVVECDEHGHPYIRHWAEDEDYTWSKTTDGTRWKGYKDGKEYRTWADLVRRYGPLTEYRPEVKP